MKAVFLVGMACLTASGCAEWTGISPGNPDGAAYAGAPGSIYDSAANPPRTIGAVAYNPDSTPMPSSDSIPPPAPLGTSVGTPPR